MFGIQQNTEVSIKHFLLTQSGTYQEQNLRPFTTRIDASVISRLETATAGGRNIGVGAVQNIAADVIQPSATPEGMVNIANGWQARRFRFLMHVVEKHPFSVGETINRIFFGYTDNSDALLNYLDPDMRIYFNSETIISEVIKNTINGPVAQAIVSGSNQIVSPCDFTGQGNGLYQTPTSHLIRPEDVFSIGQTNHTIESLQRTGQFTGGIQHKIDYRTMVAQGGQYKYSMRRDTSPTRYLADTLGAYQHAVKEAALSNTGFDSDGVNMESVYYEAQSIASNQDISSNTFLGRLKDHVGYMEKGYITYRELCSLFPEAADYERCTKFSMDTGQSIRRTNHADQAMHWNGSEPITIAASLLAQVIPAIMMDNFIRTISFAATNGMGAGMYRIEIHPQSTKMLVGSLDAISYLNEFERRLMIDVLNTITHNNQMSFSISCFADLGEDTIIDIALGAEPVRRYVAPTFTDSLFSPMITRNDQALQSVSSDLLYLVGNVIPSATHAQQAPNYQPQYPAAQLTPQSQPSVSYDAEFGLL